MLKLGEKVVVRGNEFQIKKDFFVGFQTTLQNMDFFTDFSMTLDAAKLSSLYF